MLQIWQDGSTYQVIAPGAIRQGDTANWSTGVDDDGTMWIARDGTPLAEAQGIVPATEPRENLLIGQSNWPGDTPLIGEVGEILITLGDGTPPPEPPPPAPPEPIDPGTGDMIIVAHQDDDLLFMNPSIDTMIDGPAPVTVVYMTAGDAGRSDIYWAGREQGVKDAYATMAEAESEWVDETLRIDAGGQSYYVASSYLADNPDIRTYFMRLPDGFGEGTGSGTYDNQSLQQLLEGTIPAITSVDNSATYSTQGLTEALTALMDLHGPDTLHIQDHTSEHADIEHSDHVATSSFVTQAAEAAAEPVTVVSYHSYATWRFEENLTEEEHDLVREIFLDYAAHDPLVIGDDGTLINSYAEWVQREYVSEQYTTSGNSDLPEGGAELYEALMLPEGSQDAEMAATLDAEAETEAEQDTEALQTV